MTDRPKICALCDTPLPADAEVGVVPPGAKFVGMVEYGMDISLFDGEADFGYCSGCRDLSDEEKQKKIQQISYRELKRMGVPLELIPTAFLIMQRDMIELKGNYSADNPDEKWTTK